MFEAERITETNFEPNLFFDLIRPPFRRFELLTGMSPQHAAHALQGIVEPMQYFVWWPPKRHGYFEGNVDAERFKISRILRYSRNSFVPIVEGRFHSQGGRTFIALNLRMAWAVTAFWLFMIGLVSWKGAAGVFGIRSPLNTVEMVVFLYFMASVAFGIEARIAMKRLIEVFHSGPSLVRN
jgi:hypothetical protein